MEAGLGPFGEALFYPFSGPLRIRSMCTFYVHVDFMENFKPFTYTLDVHVQRLGDFLEKFLSDVHYLFPNSPP